MYTIYIYNIEIYIYTLHIYIIYIYKNMFLWLFLVKA